MLYPPANPRAALLALAAACDGQSVVLGIGLAVTQALDVPVAGLRSFPLLPDARISDALLRFSRPLTGGYYWCPPMMGKLVDFSALG